MFQLPISDVKTFVRQVAIKHRRPVMIWGGFGIGKSEGIAQVAEEVGGIMVDVRLSQYDSVDLRGLPDLAGETTVWKMPSTIPFKNNPAFDHVPDDQLIILFLDEINSAQPSVSAVAYQLTNDRRVGEHVLRDNVVIVAAGNRASDKGVVNKQPAPLSNRFTHVEAIASVEGFSEFLLKYAKLPAQVRDLGIAFFNFRKPLLNTYDPKSADIVFATPRSNYAMLQYFGDDTMGERIKQAAMAGACGEGVTAEFMGFVDVWRKVIKVSQILKDPEGTPVPREASMIYATAVSVSGALDVKKPDEFAKLYTYLKRFEPEYVVLAWQLALKRDDKVYEAPEYLDFATRYKAIFSN